MNDELLKWIGAIVVSAASSWLALNKKMENARTRLASAEQDIGEIKAKQSANEAILHAVQVQSSATGAELKVMSRQISEMSADIKTLLIEVGRK